MMTVDGLTTAAHVSRANGAWLIELSDSLLTDGTTRPAQLFDAASSLRVAKRVARAGAEKLGWRPPFRWVEDPDSLVVILLAADAEEAR